MFVLTDIYDLSLETFDGCDVDWSLLETYACYIYRQFAPESVQNYISDMFRRRLESPTMTNTSQLQFIIYSLMHRREMAELHSNYTITSDFCEISSQLAMCNALDKIGTRLCNNEQSELRSSMLFNNLQSDHNCVNGPLLANVTGKHALIRDKRTLHYVQEATAWHKLGSLQLAKTSDSSVSIPVAFVDNKIFTQAQHCVDLKTQQMFLDLFPVERCFHTGTISLSNEVYNKLEFLLREYPDGLNYYISQDKINLMIEYLREKNILGFVRDHFATQSEHFIDCYYYKFITSLLRRRLPSA
jgi:hypothetical protein